MLMEEFTQFMIQDILGTGKYSIENIADRTNMHEDILFDIMNGYKKSLSIHGFKKIMALHRWVKEEKYHALFKKISFTPCLTTRKNLTHYC